MTTLRRSWLDDAACTTIGDDPFYPPNGEHPDAALRICATCPVTTECLEDAIRTGDLEHGIRAGLTPAQRRDLVARRAGLPPEKYTARTGRIVGSCYVCNEPTPTRRHIYCPTCAADRRRQRQAVYDYAKARR